jgi:hypothetical protein
MHEALHGRLESEPLDAQVSHTLLQLASFILSGTVLEQRFHKHIVEMLSLSTSRMTTLDMAVYEERC